MLLPKYLERNRLLSTRSRDRGVRDHSTSPRSGSDEISIYFLIVRVEPRGGLGEMISLPLAFVPADQLEQLLVPREAAWFAGISGPEPGVLCDALAVPYCCRGLLREAF